jgi:aryl-alcohol dehydrogenase-like predicted oxidoreductase
VNIPRRKLGPQGLEVSAIGLGCMGMSDFYGPSDEATNLRVLNTALDIGINFFDTADMYGVGANERLLAKVLKTRREEVVIATKFGSVRAPDGTFLGINGTPDYVRAACDASLHRLRIDHIDLYYQHRVDPKVAIEETVGAMADLVKSGKVCHLGLSEASANTIRRAAHVHPITALQSELSLWTRDLEATILPACEELDIGVVAYSPLGRGFFTGAFKKPEDFDAGDYRRTSPRFSSENLPVIYDWCRSSRRSLTRKAIRPHRWRSRGCSTVHLTWCRFRVRAASSGSKKMRCPSWCGSAMHSSSGCMGFCANSQSPEREAPRRQ